MRYSPYDMTDYCLPHRGGLINLTGLTEYDEAAWNLYWASIPQLDAVLDVAHEDFNAFNAIRLSFPFQRRVKADQILVATPLRPFLASEEPASMAILVKGCAPTLRPILGDDFEAWMDTVGSRLGMAQALIDVREAAALCKTVVAVDFRARRRL